MSELSMPVGAATHEGCPMSDTKLAKGLTADIAAIKATVEGLPDAITKIQEDITAMKVDAARLPCTEQGAKIADYEKRIRKLEYWQYISIGGFAVIIYLLNRVDVLLASLQAAKAAVGHP